jgi:hypothetical protein
MYSRIKNKIGFFIGILIVILFIVVCIAVCILYYPSSRYDKFEDTPTTTFDISNLPTAPNKSTTCKNTNDIVSVCMNYDSCCNETISNPNSGCFCSHSFVSGCNDTYKKCLADLGNGGDTSSCDSALKGCCSKYSNIDILSSNFEKPMDVVQTSNKLCTVNALPDLAQRCMELCQTNSACKAYSLMTNNCTLYDGVNYSNNTGTSDRSYIYVVKK